MLWLCKGFEAGSGRLGHEIASELRPHAHAGVLSGPSFAEEVARGQPTALVAASADAALREAAAAAFHTDLLRIYTSTDAVGVEVGGAVKNVMAIATGLCDGLAARGDWRVGQPGLNARAALITRGLAEMTRLGVALGARPETFMGLSGLGDLVLTATGELSRNRQVGLRLAAGAPLAQVLAALGHVAEGVHSAPMVLARARAAGHRDADHRGRGRRARRPSRRRRCGARADGARAARGSLTRPRQRAAGVAALAPGLEHRHRHRVAEVQAALAGAHRQAHALRGRERVAHGRRQSCRFAAEHQPVAGAAMRHRPAGAGHGW